MKKSIIFTILFNICSASVYSQVGINTESPKATLDVTATPADLTKTDGLIAPRLTGNELKDKDSNYTSDQTGAIIYATAATNPTTPKTINVTAAGYYFFDGAVWQKLNNDAQTNDWHTNGNTALATDFVGTTNDQPLNFRIDNTAAGSITKKNISVGCISSKYHRTL